LDDVLDGENYNPNPPTSTADHSLRAFVFWAAGYCHWHSELKRTKWFLEESLAMYRELGDLWSTARLLHAVSQCHSTMTGLDNKAYLMESLEIAQSLGDYRRIMGNYIRLARGEIFHCYPEQSKRYLDLAQDVAKKSGVSREVFDTFQVYYVNIQLGNFEQVRHNLEREIDGYADQKVRLRIVEGYWNLCQCYRHLGLYKEAEVIARDNLDLPYIDMIKRFQSELISLAFANEDYDAAERFFMQNARLNQMTNLQIKSHFLTGRIALSRGMLEKARSPIRRALANTVQNHYGFFLLFLLSSAGLLMAKSGHF
jgi:tetratricopeptide (TPR) repeat protein